MTFSIHADSLALSLGIINFKTSFIKTTSHFLAEFSEPEVSTDFYLTVLDNYELCCQNYIHLNPHTGIYKKYSRLS